MRKRLGMTDLTLGLVALCSLSAVASAQVTISSVKVTVSGATKTAVFCDTALSCPAGAVRVWNLSGGVHLAANQTLVLSQTGFVPGTQEGNFDTSDRADAASVSPVKECTQLDKCTVAIEINGAAVYTSPVGGDPLIAFNQDVAGNGPFNEAHQYVDSGVNNPGYTLALGYADNEHGTGTTLTCPAGGCFPTPFSGTYEVGVNGILGVCTTNCFDAGVLLITAKQTSRFTGCTVTQGGWGAAPHGNNPAAFLAAHFPAAPGVTIGLGYPTFLQVPPFFLNFTSAGAVGAFLPQGGTPGALSASAINPTSGTSAGVFAGQVLALTLNVQLQQFGSLVLSGTGTSLDGKTVDQVLAAANTAISGGALPAGFTYSSLNDLVDALNNSFDGCVADDFATAHLH